MFYDHKAFAHDEALSLFAVPVGGGVYVLSYGEGWLKEEAFLPHLDAERALRIGDTYFTVSPRRVKAWSILEGFNFTGRST